MHAGWNWNGDDWHKGMNHQLHYISRLGQMGVQLFFIVSAITLCLSNLNRQGEKMPLVHFYGRRFFRIAPAYWFGILFYWVWNLCENYYYLGHWKINDYYNIYNVFANFTFTNGFYKPGNSNIVMGGWSIGTEMAFYVIFPFLWAFQNRMPDKKIWILPTISVILTFSLFFIAYIWKDFVIVNDSFAYFNLANQINVFCIGIMGYRLILNPPSKAFSIVSFFIFFFFGSVVWKLNMPLTYYWVPAIFGISFLGLALYFSQLGENIVFKILAPIGKVSFSMYLFHFAVMSGVHIFFVKIHLLEKIGGNAIFLLLFLFTCFLTYYVAKISYKYIEQPGIRLGKRLVDKFIGTYNIGKTTSNEQITPV
jgi:peptidoglycan/LPS O-acetylase OafA/YrhL